MNGESGLVSSQEPRVQTGLRGLRRGNGRLDRRRTTRKLYFHCDSSTLNETPNLGRRLRTVLRERSKVPTQS